MGRIIYYTETYTTELLKSRKSDIQQLASVNAAGCGDCVPI